MRNLNFRYDCHNDLILCGKVVHNYGGNAALILKLRNTKRNIWENHV